MPKRSSRPKRPRDPNQLAARIVAEATGSLAVEMSKADTETTTISVGVEVPANGKNPAAVALGRLGGAKGGRARAEKLTPEQRSEIAKTAASARWKK